MEVAGELAEAADRDGDGDDEAPPEAAERRLGHSKDHRDDLPQVVSTMAVTRDWDPGAQLDVPRQRARPEDHPDGQGRFE